MRFLFSNRVWKGASSLTAIVKSKLMAVLSLSVTVTGNSLLSLLTSRVIAPSTDKLGAISATKALCSGYVGIVFVDEVSGFEVDEE